MSSSSLKTMLGFVVQQCAAELGHDPSAAELAQWANTQRDNRGQYRIFGRPISTREAGAILRHPERMVAVHVTRIEGSVPSDVPAARADNVTVVDFSNRRRA